MKIIKTTTFIFFLLFLVAACSSTGELEPTAVFNQSDTPPRATQLAQIVEQAVTQIEVAEPTATNTAVPTNAPPTAPSEATAVPEPTKEPTPEPIEIVMDNCMTCHNDKEKLIQTADPEEEKEPGESSGVG